MKPILFALLGLSFLSLNAQQFPQDWEGKWTGTVEIWSQNQLTDSFPMSLEIIPQDSIWTYTLHYMHNKTKEPDIRPYSLVPIADSLGHFAIDEANSIMLDAYYSGGCLYSAFGGMGSELLSRICLEEEHLSYEITSFLSEAVRVSGDQIIESDTIPEIKSYQVYSIMRAELRRE
ncbi:MAG: hypothetical protein AAFN10_08320 [Bacteroidota bacterium]